MHCDIPSTATAGGALAFGPVPSRRLGRSLGVNNIPPKVCTYSCVYCQVGRTIELRAERATFYGLWELAQAVQERVTRLRASSERIDHITFVPDGEPTLDVGLGREIRAVKQLGVPVAVITNGSLLGRPDVREDLMAADYVSLKVDSVCEETWRRVNRPHRTIRLSAVLQGMLDFAAAYKGTLVTETMLVPGINDADGHVSEVVNLLALLSPSTAYVAVPTRPPAEPWVRPPPEESVVKAYEQARERLGRVECLIEYEGNQFASVGDLKTDILGVTAVHPMREDALRALVASRGDDWSVVEGLLERGEIRETVYRGHKFYLKALN
jgi:wyosine [tRNA(Phe)-imidazoG37] synthetase (radical SAM superfamily)